MPEMVLRHILVHPAVTTVIPGMRKLHHVEQICRLVRLRAQGPALGARAQGARALCARVLRARALEALPARAAAVAEAALGVPRAELYGGDKVCADAGRGGDQWCYDAVRMRPVGGASQPLIHWINRPTYQQANEITSRVGR